MFSRLLGRATKTTQVRKPVTYKSRLRLEALEGREVPATFTVNSLQDLTLAEAANAPPVTRLEPAETLRSAIERANLMATGINAPHQINFSPLLTNMPFFSITLTKLRGTIAISQPLDINGSDASQMEIVGDGTVAAPLRLFSIPAPTPAPGFPPVLLPVTFSDVTLGSGISANGGAISNGGELVLERCTVKNCESTAGGGAIYSSPNSHLTLNTCQFLDNKAAGAGGGVYGDNQTQVSVFACYFFQNTSTAGNGGAVAIMNQASLTLDWASGSRSRFEKNRAHHGGAIAVMGGQGTVASLTRTDFVENTATAGEGGAVYASAGASSATFDNCLFSLNSASTIGGAVSLSTWNGTFTACAFNDNDAADGGSAVSVKLSTGNFQNCSFINAVPPTTSLIGYIGVLGTNCFVVLNGCTGIVAATDVMPI